MTVDDLLALVNRDGNFEVGDTVRVIDQTSGWGGIKPGDIGVITVITSKDSYDVYTVNLPNYNGWIGRAKCFELVKRYKQKEWFDNSLFEMI